MIDIFLSIVSFYIYFVFAIYILLSLSVSIDILIKRSYYGG